LGLPVTLRPYSGELLYSWLSRVAALYRVGMTDLLGPTVPAQELCLEPSVPTLETLAAVMRLSAPEIRALCVCSDQISQAWWNIRQITPDAFSLKWNTNSDQPSNSAASAYGTTSHMKAMSSSAANGCCAFPLFAPSTGCRSKNAVARVSPCSFLHL
jgi:hypothetical protein